MIETRDLVKRYGDIAAVDGISFRVEPGQVLGFLGPNGAGKSTTMKMIAGFLAPTAGSIRVAGYELDRDPIAAKREVEAKRIVEQQPKLQASMSVPSNTSPATRAAGRTTSTSPSGRAPLPPTVVPSSVRPPSTRSVSRMCSRS